MFKWNFFLLDYRHECIIFGAVAEQKKKARIEKSKNVSIKPTIADCVSSFRGRTGEGVGYISISMRFDKFDFQLQF